MEDNLGEGRAFLLCIHQKKKKREEILTEELL